jgi:hypothetical protein
VVEAQSLEAALESFGRIHGYREAELQEVDFDTLEKSGHTFFYVMSDGVGVMIND